MSEIIDSGTRREFSSGAVRDMASGKGRMDLLPWAAIMEVSKHCENGARKYGELDNSPRLKPGDSRLNDHCLQEQV